MKKITIGLVALVALTGCTGIITGHKYTPEEVKQIQEIARDVYKDARYVKEDMGK